MPTDQEIHDPQVIDEDGRVGDAPPSRRIGTMAIVAADRPGFLERWDPKSAMERVEHRILVAEKILPAAGKLLQPSDFVRMGSTCYCQGKGASRVEKLLALRYPTNEEPREEIIDHADGQFTVMVRGWMGSATLDTVVFAVGARSSDEGFFDKFDDDKQRLPVPRQLVVKAAWTNFRARAITELLGIQGLTPEELGKVLGSAFDASKIGEVSYKTGGKGGKQGAAQAAPEKFGPDADRGKPWADVSDGGLQYYKKAAEKNLADPANKYHNIEKARLEAVNLELQRRTDPGA